MKPFDELVEETVKSLINGNTENILSDDVFKAVQKRLREIKTNCTLVLKQMKESK